MKNRTIVLIVVLGVFFAGLMIFVSNEHNSQILTDHFLFPGFELSVFRTLVVGILVTAAIPVIYLSLKYLDLARRLKNTDQNRKRGDQSQARFELLTQLYHHGQHQKLIDELAAWRTPESRLLRAKAMLQLGDNEDALDLLKRSFFEDRQVEAGYLLAENLTHLNRSPQDVLIAIIETGGADAHRAYLLLLEYHDRAKQWASCMDLVEKMRKTGLPLPAQTAVAYEYEWIRTWADREPRKASDAFHRLIKQAPDFVPAYLALCEAHLVAGAAEKAFKIYEEGYDRTHHPVFLEQLQRYYLERDRPEDAIQVYRQLMVKLGLPAIKFQLAKLYYQLEMMDESLELLESLSSELGQIPGYLFYLADIKARRQKDDGLLAAIKEFARVQGLQGRDYICTSCRTRYESWRPRCGNCHSWNVITLEVGTVALELVTTSPLYY